MSARRQWFATAGCALVICVGAIAPQPDAHAEDSLFFMSGTRNTPATEHPVSLGAISAALTGFGSTALQLAYDASLFPAQGKTPLDLSVATGVAALNAAIAAAPVGNRIVIFSVSQGGVVTSAVEQAEIASGSTRTFLFVRLGDPSTAEGIMGRNTGIHLPGLTFVTAPAESPWDTIIIAHQYEGLSDWPVQQANLIADLNAVLGAVTYHNPWSYNVDLSSIPTGNVTVTVNSLGATTTRYLIPATGLLPILRPLQSIGVADPVLQKLQTVLKPIVDSAYEPLPNPGIAGLAQKLFVASVNGMTGMANQSGVILRQAQAAAAVAIAKFKANTGKPPSASSDADETPALLTATAELPPTAVTAGAPATADTDSAAASSHPMEPKTTAPQPFTAKRAASPTTPAVQDTVASTADQRPAAHANSDGSSNGSSPIEPASRSGTNHMATPEPRKTRRTTSATRHQPTTTASTGSALNDERETPKAEKPHGGSDPGANAPKQAPTRQSTAGVGHD